MPIEWLLSKQTKPENTSVSEDAEDYVLLVRSVKAVQLLWKILWVVIPKLKNHHIILKFYFSVFQYSKELKEETQTDICTPIFIAALSTMAKEETTQMFIDGWKDKQCGVVCVCVSLHT